MPAVQSGNSVAPSLSLMWMIRAAYRISAPTVWPIRGALAADSGQKIYQKTYLWVLPKFMRRAQQICLFSALAEDFVLRGNLLMFLHFLSILSFNMTWINFVVGIFAVVSVATSNCIVANFEVLEKIFLAPILKALGLLVTLKPPAFAIKNLKL